MAEFYSSSPESLANFPAALVAAMDGASKSIQEQEVKLLLQGNYGSVRSTVDFRKVINAVVPIIMFINYKDIKTELQKYRTVAAHVSGPQAIRRQESFSHLEYTKEGTDTFNAMIDDMVAAVKRGVDNFKTSSNPTKQDYKVLIQRISTRAQMGEKLLEPNTIISLTGDKASFAGPDIEEVFVFSDFNTTSVFTARVSKVVKDHLINAGKTSFKEGILDLGHAVGRVDIPDNEAEYLGNFPKLTQVLLEKILDTGIKTNSVTLPTMDVVDLRYETAKFVQDTTQFENIVTIHKEFSDGFLKIFVSLGGQIGKFENSSFNQFKGRTLESVYPGGSGSVVAHKLLDHLVAVRDNFIASAQKTLVHLILSKAGKIAEDSLTKKGSPSLLDFLELNIVNLLKGASVNSFKNTRDSKGKVLKSKTTQTIKTKFNVKSGNSTIKVQKFNFPALRAPTGHFTSLTSIQNIINQSLAEQIRTNMGTGDRKDVLNYRTGRFAGSARVERMSQSRDGMVTAFYSYMRNPYGTFSTGGAQEYPKTRDPKLLISKSIREIGVQAATNRMRAVLV